MVLQAMVVGPPEFGFVCLLIAIGPFEFSFVSVWGNQDTQSPYIRMYHFKDRHELPQAKREVLSQM